MLTKSDIVIHFTVSDFFIAVLDSFMEGKNVMFYWRAKHFSCIISLTAAEDLPLHWDGGFQICFCWCIPYSIDWETVRSVL